MSSVAGLALLYDAAEGDALPLTESLQRFYGDLRVAGPGNRPMVIGNFVETLDGVVALKYGPGAGGAEISGSFPPDRALMGLLRAASDVVVVGAGTVRTTPRHNWTPEGAFAAFADDYRALRQAEGKGPRPHRAVVTGSGGIDLDLPVFNEAPRPTLVLTTEAGQSKLGDAPVPNAVRIKAAAEKSEVPARFIVDEIARELRAGLVLVEGGPRLLGQFIAEKLLDELFLTLAPQVAGRDGKAERPGLVAGRVFAPLDPRWATLIGVRRGESHLFLRYRFAQ